MWDGLAVGIFWVTEIERAPDSCLVFVFLEPPSVFLIRWGNTDKKAVQYTKVLSVRGVESLSVLLPPGGGQFNYDYEGIDRKKTATQTNILILMRATAAVHQRVGGSAV